MAIPTYSSQGTVLTNATVASAPTFDVLLPAHTSGDLLLLHVLCRNGNNDGTLTSINTTGWTQAGGAAAVYGGAQNARLGFGWKIGNGSETICQISSTGGTTQDRMLGCVYRFRSDTGFASPPVQNIGTSTQNAASVTVSMPSVTTPIDNCLAASLIAMSNSTTSASATGETGGDWTEALTESAGLNGTITMQTAAMATAGTISGGTITITSSAWVCVGFAIVPGESVQKPASTVMHTLLAM